MTEASDSVDLLLATASKVKLSPRNYLSQYHCQIQRLKIQRPQNWGHFDE